MGDDPATNGPSNTTRQDRTGRDGPLKAVLFGVWLTSLGAFLAALEVGTAVGFGAVAVTFGSGVVAVGLARW